ncbi:hypothetical protein [Candidatus Tisiphia endosymbiont of Oplodontha viridula]
MIKFGLLRRAYALLAMTFPCLKTASSSNFRQLWYLPTPRNDAGGELTG